MRDPQTGCFDAAGAGGTLDEATRRRNRIALVLLLAATFTVFLNETAMSVAIPDIQESLGVSASTGQWLTTAFALTMAVVIPITGWLLQVLSTRTLYIAAMTLFSIGTLIAAVSPVFGLLVVGRVVQASGTAVMMPLMMTTMLTVVPPQDRGRIMGRVSIVMSMAPAVGPAFSGLLLTVLPWAGLFWVMLPIALVMLVAGIAWIPNVSEQRKTPLDVPSVILSAIGFSALVYGLSSLGESAGEATAIPPVIPIVVGVVGLVAFVLRQVSLQKRDAALLDLRTFRSSQFTMSLVMLAVGMLALFGTVILIPQFVQNALGQDASVVGLLLLPGGLLMGALGPIVGRLYDKVGPRVLVVPGSIVISLAFWIMALTFGDGTPLWVVLASHIVLSLGLAFLFTPLFTTGLGSLTPKLYSHGSATVATLQQVAAAAGTALFVALFAIGILSTGATDLKHASPSEVAGGVHYAFLFGAGISMVVIVLAFFIRRPADQPGMEGAPAPH
ncbi:multidrug efflux MFS transporter [Schumannella soli]|uniref:Multidrug efflux MFS transporter n=1 Tax=Schumannella soli TaxID=2590779 RepID=A0A506Y3L4_9MICO|nr:multidrug efflux MFS transporter [Schumannella soli]